MKAPKSSVIIVLITFCALLVIFLATQVALAHETVSVGDYDVEYGWVSEPAVVGQPNAVVVNLSSNITPTTGTSTEIDISALQIMAVFGPQSKQLTLQPLGENTPGQYIAPITPMLPGIYTIHLGGSIGSTVFNTDVQPEEVKTADVVQFPQADPATTTAPAPILGLAGGLGIAGIVLGAIGIVFGLLSFNRKSS